MGVIDPNTGAGGSKNFFKVVSGKLAISSKEREQAERSVQAIGGDPTKVQHLITEDKDGNKHEKYVYYVNGLSGMLTSAKIKELQYGDVLELELSDVGETFVIDLGIWTKNHGITFLNKCHNLDLSQEVTVGVYDSEQNGKTYRGTWLKQGDTKIEAKWGRDSKEIPQAVTKKVGKKVTWDFSDRDNFLFEKFEKEFLPQLGADPQPATVEEAPEKPKAKANKTQKKDDLPF